MIFLHCLLQELSYSRVERIHLLAEVCIPTSTLHSTRQQKERVASQALFKIGHIKVLVATAVASRGLDNDIPGVKLGVNHYILVVS